MGIPRFRFLPFDFGICTLFTGLGLYFLALICPSILSLFSFRCSRSSSVDIPSIPAEPLLDFTLLKASFRLFLWSIFSICSFLVFSFELILS